MAMQFLSRVPMGKTIIASDKLWAQSVYCYPLVGAVLGVILVTLSYLLSDISTVLAAIIVLTVLSLIHI